jgi:hypothetical protein
LQLIYNITDWDTRTLSTWAGLLMHIYMLDEELDWDHEWHSEGGAELFERLVFKIS